jgi:hypothetical protein
MGGAPGTAWPRLFEVGMPGRSRDQAATASDNLGG